jgi:sulfonate transport system substrate-binding protein
MSISVRIGIHATNLSLAALSKSGILERKLEGQGAHVQWVKLPLGPKTPDYIGANLIDVGGTGATPPITGQANDIPLVYIATSKPRPLGGIYVRAFSPIQSVHDLKGKRVGLAVGSWLQQLLALSLRAQGVAWADIVPLDLSEAVSHEALLGGQIDAWATGTTGLDEPEVLRAIVHTRDVISNPSTFVARREFAEQHPELLQLVVDSLDEIDHWVQDNPTEAAQLFVHEIGEYTAQEWERAIRARPWGLVPVTESFLDEQQETANAFSDFNLLRHRINVREALLARPPKVGSVTA